MGFIELIIKKLFSNHSIKKYFFNTGWLLADNILKLILGLFVGIYVARYLGPEQYGVLSFSISFVVIFGALARLGLNNIIVRNVLMHPDQRDEILGTALVLRIGGGILLFGVVYIAIQFTKSDHLTRFLVMIIASGFIAQAFEVIEYYFQSQVNARPVTTAKILVLLIISIIKLTFIWFAFDLAWFAAVVAIEEFLKGILLTIQYLRQGWHLSAWRFKTKQAKILLKDSWPLVFSGLALLINMRIDQVMINEFLGSKAVGIYAVSVKLSEVWFFVPIAIAQSLYPAIVDAKKRSQRDYYHRLQQLYDFMIWLSISVALAISLLGEEMVVFLYGTAYQQAGSTLMILIWSGIFVSLNLVSSKWLLSENMQFFAFVCNGMGALFNIFLNISLIPLWGINGAAIATLISQSISSYFVFLITKKARMNFKLASMAFIYPIRYIIYLKKKSGET